jgi:flagellar basal-body rod protein FlgF
MDAITDVVGLTVGSMQNDIQRMNLIANHAANALTSGFKRSLVAVTNQSDSASLLGVAPIPMQTSLLDLKPGIPRKTGVPLDVSLLGDGFFEAKTASGPVYTRAGAFHIDDRGRLVTQSGDAVSGLSGDILLTTQSPLIDRAGKVFEKGEQVGQLKVVTFSDPNRLQAVGNGVFVAPAEISVKEVQRPQMLQGHLESSNVDSAREMVSMIETFRHFETSQRLLQVYDDLRDRTFRNLGQF